MNIFDRIAKRIARLMGHPAIFAVACLVILVWGALGPVLGYSDSWQLMINTSTTIVTFLMVFLVQQTQNKDSVAVHLKLNELLASHEYASNHVIAIESLSEEELQTLRKFYAHLAELADKEGGVKRTHSLDDALRFHARKRERRGSI